MADELAQVIFDQFVDIVKKMACKKTCCVVDECKFDYRTRERRCHKFIDVIYSAEDKCNKRRDLCVTIEYTDVCFKYLSTCKWFDYLEKIACELVEDICPKKIVIKKDEPKRCRSKPQVCEPFPCKTVTYVCRERPVEPVPVCEVIIERECECSCECERKHCVPENEIVITYI